MKKIILSFSIITSCVVFAMHDDTKQQLRQAFQSLPCNAIAQFTKTFAKMSLDDKSIKEFIGNKEEIIDECVDCELKALHANKVRYQDDQTNAREDILYKLKENNKLLETYYDISRMEPAQAIILINSTDIQQKLQQLQAIVFAAPEYHEKLAQAQLTNDENAWKEWRYKAGDELIKPFLKEKGLQVPEKRSTYEHVKANAGISKETARWIIAHSALMYKNRQLQRLVTGKDLPAIQIHSNKK